MTDCRTEDLHSDAIGLDARPLSEVAALLAEAQIAASTSLRGNEGELARAAEAMAATILRGDTLRYVAAGSSGLMAAADAQELGGTYSIAASQLRIHMAGGLPQGVEMPGDTEDDASGLDAELADLVSGDCVLAVSASGRTPYTVAAARRARDIGATVIAIANNPGAPLLSVADHPILLATPPEMVSGSTRMGAGTAQKIALNILSTLMAVRLGHVHDGMMVNLRADNDKLRSRARDIVCRIADVAASRAEDALDASDGRVKPAVLMAARGMSNAQAVEALDGAQGNLRAALTRTT